MSTWERVKIYSAYERVWHGVQAGSVLGLLATGLEIRGAWSLLGFATAVRLHEALGFFLLANAFLGLFYFLTSGAIRQYVAEPRDFATLAVRQARYYLRGIFRGEPHPVARTARARLNPLQQVVYVGILNVLLPWQILTGLAAWGLERWPALESAVGGLGVLMPLHALGAWMFATFVLAHVYLTTTAGRRPLSGMAAMVTGWDEVERHAAPAAKEATS
jgi:thiosulfate reductase cytochrome b subunit